MQVITLAADQTTTTVNLDRERLRNRRFQFCVFRHLFRLRRQ
ncbi:MAG: hypothetical protein BWX48_00979 [Verrucomicrobia bacterium ADurb.Bin006]|nr:MAG: hypothetical protein BWX48_00979 [Verrucomicrobia bacterium ADurb.Bin006]